ncbi:MAG: ester cyclase [Chloroflexi bacterium]|nr:ester cyclase [Chloroflexota bacterium]
MASNLEVIEAFHRAMEEYWRTGDDAPLMAIFDPACTFSVPGMPDTLEGMRQALPAFRQAFSDIAIHTGETVSEGDMIGYRMSFTGTHSGDFMGISPTGRRIFMSETHIERIRDGKIVLHSGNTDMLGLMQQVGALPGPN